MYIYINNTSYIVTKD